MSLPVGLSTGTSGHLSHHDTLHASYNGDISVGKVRFVSKGGSDSNSGLSWGEAFLTVGAALSSLETAHGTAPVGTVYVGPGTFFENAGLPISYGTQIVGSGLDFTNGTVIKLAASQNADLFVIDTSLSGTTYLHGMGIRNCRLDGNRDNNTSGDIVNIQQGGWSGCFFYDVIFNDAAEWGVRHTGNALNVQFINVTFTQCVSGAIRSEMTAGAGYTWMMFNTQVDDCGFTTTDPVFYFIDNTTSYDTRQIGIYGLKVESGTTSSGKADRVIQLESAATQSKGFHLTLENANSVRDSALAQGTAFVYELAGNANAQESRVTFINVSGRKIDNLFESAKTGQTILGNPLRSFNNPATPDTTSRQVYLATTHGPIWSGGSLALTDGMTAPDTITGWAQIYVDTSDGDLKVKYGDGTVKTIVVDT